MENENILVEDVKVKNGYRISLIIIACIVVLLAGVGCYFYFKGGDSRSTYINFIDSFSSEVIEGLEKAENQFNKPVQSKYDVSFELSSNSTEFKEIATILNKLGLTLNMEMDINSKKANMNLGVTYNNDNMINGDLILNNQDVYGNLNELYAKTIKIDVDGIDQIWDMYNFESYKIIVEEFTNILKNNLKEEFFSSSKETIEVLGKEINTTKHSMTLNGNDIYDLEHRILSEIETNEKLMAELVDISGLTKEEIKDSIAVAKEELVLDESKIIVFEIYLNRNNVEKVTIKDNEEEVIALNKTKENEFEILIKENEEFVTLGSIALNDDNTKLVIDYEEVVMTYEMSDTVIYLSVEAEDDVVELKCNISDTSSNGYIRVVSSEDDMDLKVKFTNEIKKIDKVSDVNISNYVELEQMTDNDYNTIMEALYQNNAVLTLMQDIMSLSASYSANSY